MSTTAPLPSRSARPERHPQSFVAPVLVRPRPACGPAVLALDESQRRVVDHRPGGGPLVVLGAPGTGRTTALVEALVARVERDGADASSLLVLAPSRRAASALRDRVSARLSRTTTQPLARTPQAYAWALLRRAAVLAGEPPPRLLSGPEQASVLGDLLAGHEQGGGHPPAWPPALSASVRALRGFRAELRDLLMRALEHGVGPSGLAALGRERGRPEWVAAAGVLAEYLDVVALSSPGAHDPGSVVQDAAALLRAQPGVLAAERARWSLIAVDDHHESTPSTAALLDLVAGGGGDLVLTGDPDATTSTFRGGDPALLARAADRHRSGDGAPARVVVLSTRWRHGEVLAAVSARVAAGIGSVGAVEHRRATAAPRGRPQGAQAVTGSAPDPLGVVEGHVLASASREAAFVAGLLRAEHVCTATAWSSMAVVVRSAGSTALLRRALAAAGVPVAAPVAQVPLRSEAAVAPLLLALDVALRPTISPADPADPAAPADPADPADSIDPAAPADPIDPADSIDLPVAGTPALDAAEAVALLASAIGGADPLALRRLRRSLLAVERAAGGERSSDALLVAALEGGSPAMLAGVPALVAAPARRVARVLAAGRAALAAPDPSPEGVLWALWDATGLVDRWRSLAVGGGTAGARADADLDAVVALFDVASRTAERSPGTTPAQLLEAVRAEDIASDTLGARAPDDDAVALLTPAGAAGREWDLVVIPGLQDGAWPDTRLRGTLLGSDDLADVLTGRTAGPLEAPGSGGGRRGSAATVSARRKVIDDERRLLHVAVTRARSRLVVTAVRDDDERPSAFLDLVAPLAPDGSDDDGTRGGVAVSGEKGTGERPLTDVPRWSSLPAVVAELRGSLLTPPGVRDATGTLVDAARRRDAAAALARLALAGVPGADPDEWHGLVPLSDGGPLRDGDELVRISPSSVSTFTECSLRWLLEAAGGSGGTSVSQGVGTLVHAIAAQLPDGTPAQMEALLEDLWPGLGLPDSWVGGREYRRARAAVIRLAGYVASARAAGREVVAVEAEVSAQIGRALVRGRLDRVERDAQGRLRVVDLKTGSSAPTEAELARHPQLGLYQALVEAGALGDDPGVQPTGGDEAARSAGAALVQVGTGRKKAKEQAQAALADDADPGWAHALLASTAQGMADSAFLAQANQHCGTCPVSTSCPLQEEP